MQKRRQIEKGIKILKEGGVIAFPTETVYGLGAALNRPEAIEKIFKIKKRSKKKPFQILISNFNQLKELVKNFPPQAKTLAKKHWPGPLTLVLKKSRKVPSLVTAGTPKVGIRMPDHKIALELIKKCGPLVATSANLSGKLPALTAKEVKNQLPQVDFVIDGGKYKLGIASAVVDATYRRPRILRKGDPGIR